jgi:hypothetical protein
MVLNQVLNILTKSTGLCETHTTSYSKIIASVTHLALHY